MLSFLSRRPARSSSRRTLPRLEVLEDRSVPAVLGNAAGAPIDYNVGPTLLAFVNANPLVSLDPAGLVGASSRDVFDTSGSPHPSDWVQNWMSQIPDNKYLSELDIPGTHDSGTQSLSIWAKTQGWTVSEQLTAGIRFLDIRIGNFGDTFDIVHGSIKVSGLTFDDVLETCYSFLKSHQTETIIMSVQRDAGDKDTFADRFKNYLDEEHKNLWYTEGGVPTLGKVRGKIVLVAREKGIGGILWANLGNQNMKIQDDWNNPPLYYKWNEIVEYLRGATCSPYGQWFINFCSANGVSGVEYWARDMNSKLYNLLTYKTGRIGTILLDFPGVKLVERIILSNVRITPLGLPIYDEYWNANLYWRFRLENREFVSTLYTNLLGRSGSDTEVEGWVNKLKGGKTRLDVFNDFVNSAEYRGLQVNYFYRLYLGRNADPEGKAHYIARLQNGDSLEDIVVSILASPELAEKIPDNAKFVAHLYRNVLGWVPSDGEDAVWVNKLNNGTSREVAVREFLKHYHQALGLKTLGGTYAALPDLEAEQLAAVDALMGQPNAVGTVRLPSLPSAIAVRDLAFLPQREYGPPARVLLTAASGGAGERTTTDVQGILFGDCDGNGDCSDGEPRLSSRVVRLVDEQGAVVAEATTGPEGEYRFAGVPAGQYWVEAEPSPDWDGAVSPAFTVDSEPVTAEPLGLPPAVKALEEGALPADEGAPSAEEPTSFGAKDAVWVLLGAALPAFRSRQDRRPAATAATRRRRF